MNHHLKYKFGITFGIYIKAIVCVVLEDLLQAILCEHFCTTFFTSASYTMWFPKGLHQWDHMVHILI